MLARVRESPVCYQLRRSKHNVVMMSKPSLQDVYNEHLCSPSRIRMAQCLYSLLMPLRSSRLWKQVFAGLYYWSLAQSGILYIPIVLLTKKISIGKQHARCFSSLHLRAVNQVGKAVERLAAVGL